MTEATQRPIAFSQIFIEPIEEGIKTQTRRIVKFKNKDGERRLPHPNVDRWVQDGGAGPNAGLQWCGFGGPTMTQWCGWIDSPFGKVGDLLTVIDRPDIRLEVTALRIERLQAITLGDVVKDLGATSMYVFRPVQDGFRVFAEMWDEIHQSDDSRWEANPWVWVVDFARATPEAGRIAGGES